MIQSYGLSNLKVLHNSDEELHHSHLLQLSKKGRPKILHLRQPLVFRSTTIFISFMGN